jgi:hypothetical protein
MPKYHPNTHLLASNRIHKALSLLTLAGSHIASAIQASPDRYHADRLRSLDYGLQELRDPLNELAGSLKVGDQ